MSDEEDYIVLSVGEDSDDDDDDDDFGAVITRDFDTDFTEDSSEEVLVLLTDSEDDSDSTEELPAFSHEMEDFEALNSQIVSCLAVLKGGNPDSEEVESVPLCRKARLSIPEDDHMNPTAEDSFNGHRHNQISRLQRYCQAIYDAIRDLDKKFDIIHGKVSKIHRSRCRVKSTRQSRKLHGNKNNYQHSRKSKSHKRRRRDCPSSLSLTESYSPTIPTSRQDDDSQNNTLGTSFESQKSPEQEQELSFQDQEPDLNQSPTIFTQSYEPYEYVQEEPVQGPSYCSSPRASFFSLNQAIVTPPGAILPQMEPEPIPPPNVVTYPPLFDPQPSVYNTSPPCTPNTYAPTSPVRNKPYFFKENIPEDPSTWSVDEVIMFLQDVDPQTLDPLVNLFRDHGIDGKALLLLRSDMMITYMGLKVGTALKICHYIDRLKRERYIPNS